MAKDTENNIEGATPFVDGKKEFELSDGRKVVIVEGRGIHSREALKVAGGDGDKYLSALMAQCVTIEGKKIVMEDLDAMRLKDFTKIQTEFADLNF